MTFRENHTGVRRFFRYSSIALVGLLLGCFAWAQSDLALKEGDRAPNFSISTDQAKRLTPTRFGGNLLVLNFWETACVPCVKELPSLSDFARAFREQGVVAVAVSGDEDAQKYSRFLTDHHVALETYRDPARQLSKSFGTYEFPETYIIQHGQIVRKIVGGIDWMGDDTSSLIRKQLASK
jgi:cytochrome c biogenesis protein CcmG/thiol:disulfide interchange protein DsbE